METMQIVYLVIFGTVFVSGFLAFWSLLSSLESIAKSLKQMSGRTDAKK